MDASKKHENPNPKLTASWFSRLFFWWLKPFFVYGKYNDLEVKDIYNALPSDVSQLLGDKLERNWMKEVKKAEGLNRKPSFYSALRNTFAWTFAFYGGYVLFLAVVLRVLQPFCLGLLIRHFDPRSSSTKPEAYTYASTVVFLSILTAFIQHHSYLGLMQLGMRLRIASSSLIYRKILRLARSSTKVATPGQIVNLLSNDVSRFEQVFILMHYIWILPIQGALIAFLIWESVGIASLAGVFLISVQTIPVQGYMSKWTSKLRLRIAIKTDERVRLMSEIISGIQVIKMYTWEKPFEKLVSIARQHEVDVLTITSYLRGFTLATFVFTERTTLYFTVMAYVLMGNDISADKVFSMAQYFNILQATMAIFYPQAVAYAAEAAVSVNRLEAFLLLKENQRSLSLPEESKVGGIKIKEVAASWGEGEIANALHDISVRIEPGKLYAVVGTVGAGKSSFLQLILQELQPVRGSLQINGTVSYASQEAWLFSGTIRNNILFGQPYNQKRYEQVVKVCALSKDFRQFNYGDRTLVGDRGAMLSGGQRARINLARAVYRNADIYLLDDPLSAVDTHVGKHLFDECISGYLKDKTRILVTHQIQCLKHCDHILVFDNGKIEYTGTYAELQNQNINLLEMIASGDSKEGSASAEDTSTADVSLNSSESKEPEKEEEEEEEEQAEPKETEELMGKGGLSKAIFWQYCRAGASVFTILLFLLVSILGQLGSSGGDYWVAYWTKQEELRIKELRMGMNWMRINGSGALLDEETTDWNETDVPPLLEPVQPALNLSFVPDENSTSVYNGTVAAASGKYLSTELALWVYGAFIILGIIMTTTRNLMFYKICMSASKNLHNLMFSCLLKAPMAFFNTNPSGRILNRFSKDIGAVDEVLPRTMIESIQIFLVMVGILTQVLIISWWSVFPMVAMGFLYWEIRKTYLRTAQNIKRLEGTTKSPVFSHVNSSLTGLSTIRAAEAQQMLRKEFDVHQDLHTGAYFLTVATSTAFGFALDIVSIAFVAFITFSFVILEDGNTFAGNVGLAISQVLILCGMLQHGMRQTAETISQMTSVERILQFTKLEKEGPFESLPSKRPSTDWPSNGEIRFDHLYLRYDTTAPPILKDLSFTIKPGEKVGIVGRTGAGKTSLISALFHLSELDGAIYIDNKNTKELGLHDLRSKISIIPQEPILFSATLRNNLDPFNNYDDLTLWAALEDVELKEAVRSLDYQVEQGGANFSAGQRQLLCLARAIIKNNRILVLDEATANVDPATDGLIQKTIRGKFSHCTVLTIAHRLNTIIDYDKVLVMDHGRAAEFDHPYILLQKEDSQFTSLVQETGRNMFAQLKKLAKEAYERTS